MNAPRRARALLLACLGGVLFALTAPPTNLYPIVIVGLALLAVSIADAPTFWRAFGRGAAWGTSAGIVGLRFVPAVILRFTPLGTFLAYLSLVLLAAAQSLIWAIGAGVAHELQKRLRAPLELAFAGGVFVAVSLPTVFAWTPGGLMSPWPSFVQLGDVIGERGVSVVFAMVAALLARSALATFGLEPGKSIVFASAPRFSRAVSRPALAAVATLAFVALYGAIRIDGIQRASADLPTVSVALVDQAVGPEERWQPKNHPTILRNLKNLTHDAEAAGAELTVWPEAAYPYAVDHEARVAPKGWLSPVGSGVHGPLLIGLITRAQPTDVGGHVETNSYNSATVVLPDGSLQAPYDKLQLLWFGEMVPGGAQLPWLRHVFQKSGGLIPGVEPRGLVVPRGARLASRGAEIPAAPTPSLQVAVLNCYEDTLADVGLRLAGVIKPNLLVNVTNDAWFFGTAEPELHARLAVMRAVEQRRDLVRAVNMGVASWVDAAGIVRARYDKMDPGVLQATPAVRDDGLTLYARFGDRPLGILMLIAIAAVWLRSRRPVPEPTPADPSAP